MKASDIIWSIILILGAWFVFVLIDTAPSAQPMPPMKNTFERDIVLAQRSFCLSKCVWNVAFTGSDEQKAQVKQCLEYCNAYRKTLH
jgi:hypothetical protein